MKLPVLLLIPLFITAATPPQDGRGCLPTIMISPAPKGFIRNDTLVLFREKEQNITPNGWFCLPGHKPPDRTYSKPSLQQVGE